jgi:uncharacterized protein (TIGR01370 family)
MSEGARRTARTAATGAALLGLLLSVDPTAAGEPASDTLPTVAFYYGAELPADELRAFDVVVVEPDHGFDPAAYRTSTSELFAYVSLGEVEPRRLHGKDMPASWFNGENTEWGARVVDQTQPAWPAFVVERIVGPLVSRGYRGLFLDTLDSYQLAAKTPEACRRQEQGLASVIRAIKKAYPDLRLIFNRGFEILPDAHREAYAVAVESLYQEWDQAQKRYGEVSESEREWIMGQLKRVTDEYRLPVIVIDYVPPAQRELARQTARKIMALGFIPWVSTPALDYLGIGSIEVMPRKILMLYDGQADPDLMEAPIHRFLDFPVNYLGYVPDHWDVRQGLPAFPLAGRYAGILTWFRSDDVGQPALPQWLQAQAAQGLKILVFDRFGFPLDAKRLGPLGLALGGGGREMDAVSIAKKDRRIGYEIEPLPNREEFVSVRLQRGESLLALRRGKDDIEDAIAFTPWGGYALSPYVVAKVPQAKAFRWHMDPIRFIRDGLALPAMPVPDATTENGRRLLLIHIDGDGFPSRAEWPGTPYAGDVVLKQILGTYRVPTTVSVIEGEVAATGQHPKLAPQLEQIARRIFALPHVEIASHSFSHPFFWKVEHQDLAHPDDVSLAIPGYRYSPTGTLDREIKGSLDYIDRTLAPSGKRTEVFLWSGDTNPSDAAVAKAYEAGVYNMNGGDTLITKTNPSLTAVAPLGLLKGGAYQVFAPNQNENEYTNLWTGPFYGFERVIETFQLTETPRRLKPINIYYHFYSGTKKASLRALKKVYDWALAQPVSPVSVSDYVKKVLDFQRLVIARDEQGWRVRGAESLREFRADAAWGYPDLAQSRGVMGFADREQDRYIHVSGETEVRLRLTRSQPQIPYLKEADAPVRHWRREQDRVEFGFRESRPVRYALGHADRCRVTQGVNQRRRGAKAGSPGGTDGNGTGTLTISCRP